MNEIQAIQNKIYEIRGQRVMLDFDLAEMYGVETRRLNEQVKRNIERFPEDFMFQLTKGELEILKSQIVISSYPVLPFSVFYELPSLRTAANWMSQIATSNSPAPYRRSHGKSIAKILTFWQRGTFGREFKVPN